MQLHQYQKNAIKFSIVNKAVFLALDLGLGKTAVALEVIRRTKKPAIVFAPLKVIYNTWPDEIVNWAPELTYTILHGPDKDRLFRQALRSHIILLNYDGMKWFFNKVAASKLTWKQRTLIIDESSMIKSPTTLRFKLLKKMIPLWGPNRLCLSATPSPNGYYELWSQYYMLDQGQRLFSSYHRFRGTYFNYTGPPLYKTTIRQGAYERIKDLIKPITYRLDANDHLKMPEVTYNEIPLALSEKLRQQYKDLEDDFILEFQGSVATAFNAAALAMKLRQFIQGAVYTDAAKGEFYPLHNIKCEALKELIDTAVGRPILCPIQFKFELIMLQEFFKKEIPCIAGRTSNEEANILIRKWNKGLMNESLKYLR